METMQGTLAVAAFVLVAVVLAFAVPVWVPRVIRAFRRGVAVSDYLPDFEAAARAEAMLERQRADWRLLVERTAIERGLPPEQLPALSLAMDRWWAGYAEGRISWHSAYCEAVSWINRRVRQAPPACAADVAGGAA